MEQNSPLATPNSVDKNVKGPKALFWYLTLFFTLGITAFNTGGLWFQYINKWLPKEISEGFVQGAFSQRSVKFSLASLIVGVPLFFLFSYLIRQALKNQNLNRHNKIRIWITYIILFLTIAIAAGDLITTVFRVLDGDYTLRFLLKSLAILVIVSWIFIYYWLELRSANSLANSKIPKIMAGVTITVIILSFIGSFFIIESPSLARAKAYDRTRIQQLQNLRYNIENYYYQNKKLPINLEELTSENAYLQLKDPQTDKPYQYNVIDQNNYELCADFETSNKEPDYSQDFYAAEFAHEAGYYCFKLKVIPAQEAGRPIPTKPIY
jgi:hypothetical protein